MANVDAAFGFRPIRRLDGAAWTGNHTIRTMLNSAGALNRGDVVKTLADGTVAVGTAANTVHSNLGVFVGCKYLNSSLGYTIWTNYWPGSGATGNVEVEIIDDPNVVFEVQSVLGPVAVADIGQNADFTVVASTTGFSKWSLAAPTTTATLPFRVIGLGAGGAMVGNGYDHTTAYNIVEVMWNDQMHRQFVAV